MRLCLESAEILPFFHDLLFLFKIYYCILKRTCHCHQAQKKSVKRNALIDRVGNLTLYIYTASVKKLHVVKKLDIFDLLCSEFENHSYISHV